MSRVVHFEIHAEQPERAIAFYEGVFGWRFDRWPGGEAYWVITTGPDHEPGINGGLVTRRGLIDGQAVIAYVCTIQVADTYAAEAAVLAQGGAIALPRMPVPGVGWLFYAKDPEGNIFGVMQPDERAA